MKKVFIVSSLICALLTTPGCSTLKDIKGDPVAQQKLVTQFKTIAYNGVAGLLDIQPEATNYVRAVGAVITIALNDKVYDYNDIVRIAEVEIQEFAKPKYRAVARIVLTAYQTAIASDVASELEKKELAHALLSAGRDAIEMALGSPVQSMPTGMAAKRSAVYIQEMHTDDTTIIWISDTPYSRCPQDGSLVKGEYCKFSE